MALWNLMFPKIPFGCKLGKVLQIRLRAEQLAVWMMLVAWLNRTVIMLPHLLGSLEIYYHYTEKHLSRSWICQVTKQAPTHVVAFYIHLHLLTPRHAWPLYAKCHQLSVWPQSNHPEAYLVLRKIAQQKLLWK